MLVEICSSIAENRKSYKFIFWNDGTINMKYAAALFFSLVFSFLASGLTGEEPLAVSYQGKFCEEGWSETCNAHSPCLSGQGYLTDLSVWLVNGPKEKSGEVSVYLSTTGQEWEKAAAVSEESLKVQQTLQGEMEAAWEEEKPLEGIRMSLTGEIAQEYDLYYRVFQNGGWLPWTSNGRETGISGQGQWISGVQAVLQKKGMEPPADPEPAQPSWADPVDPDCPMVALTFDDGPRASVTDRILGYLRDAGGRATFFMIGNRVKANEDTVNQMVAQGCQVANHTYDHQYLSSLGRERMQQQIGAASQAVLDACGVLPVLVRPPGGKTNRQALTMLETMGFPAVLWSVDTKDWQNRDAGKIVETVLSQVKDGDIVLMHDIYPSTADAAAVIIPALKEKGFQLVTVSELASFRGGMMPGRLYRKFSPGS